MIFPALKNRRVMLSVFLALSCVTVGAQSKSKKSIDTTNSDQATIARVESEWLTALNTADVDAVAKILADDFLRPAPDSGQFVNKTDLLGYYRSHLKPQSPNQRRIEDMTVSVYGDAAIARGKVVSTGADGKVVSTLLFTDVFAKRNGKWQAVSAQENQATAPGH